MKAINIKQFDNKGFFQKVNDYLRKEQREFLFNKKTCRKKKNILIFLNFFLIHRIALVCDFSS
jgi:hypothetical protein